MMCETCGCGQANSPLREKGAGDSRGRDSVHSHPHPHPHPAPLTKDAAAESGAATKRVELEQRLLARNDEAAAANRRWLAERGVVAVNLISSPGSGKTTLLERTLDRLQNRVPCAVIAGDQQTDLDARRLSGRGAHVHALETGSACHLNAEQVGSLLPHVVESDTRLLFIENVGNLVCPAAFDLGESFKVAVLSTPEGEDKPLKYPSLFVRAGVVVVNKIDLAPHVGWDAAVARRNIRRIHPGVFIFELSAKTGEGFDAWLDYLLGLI